MKWIKQLFSRRRLYGDLSDEIQEHLEEKIEELVAGGTSRKEAAAAARREFGNVTFVVMQIPNYNPRRLLAMVLEYNRSCERLFPNRLESARIVYPKRTEQPRDPARGRCSLCSLRKP